MTKETVPPTQEQLAGEYQSATQGASSQLLVEAVAIPTLNVPYLKKAYDRSKAATDKLKKLLDFARRLEEKDQPAPTEADTKAE